MNHNDTQSHITEDELIALLIDENDLPSHRRAHLSSCEQCMREKETFEQQLSGLGQQAESLAPELSGKLRLPAGRIKQSANQRYWIPAFGSALAMVLIVMATWWSGALNFSITPDPVDTHVAESDEDLLMQIGALIDNPLPDAYREIAVMTDFDIDDELMDFIVPSIENGHNA